MRKIRIEDRLHKFHAVPPGSYQRFIPREFEIDTVTKPRPPAPDPRLDAMSGQNIQGLADELEKHICDQLRKPRPAGVLRRMKVNQLVSNVNKPGEVRRDYE